MGLFDKMRGMAAPTFDVQRAMMTIIVAAVKSDGHVSSDEVMRVRSICSGTPIYSNNSSDEDTSVINFADNVTDQLGDAAIDQASAALKPELRETAFALACDMVLADGMLTQKEENYLSGLARRLNIPEHVLTTVVEATMIRNRSA